MKIEDYLRHHKDEMDVEKVDGKQLWYSIRQAMRENKVKRMQVLHRVAALVLVFLVVGSLLRHELVMQKQITSLSQINKDLAKKERAYKKQVDEKWLQFTRIHGGKSPMEPVLLNELKYLDTLYSEGLEEIITSGYNERTVIILLDTYEKRLHIIEHLINEKQKSKNYEYKSQQVKI